MKRFTLLLLIMSMLSIHHLFGQKEIKGTVSDNSGAGVPGVTVIPKGIPEKGTVTNIEGKYSIDVPENTSVLVFSFVGMNTQEVEINNRVTIDVVMENEDVAIDDIVVTALGIKRERKALAYAIGEVSDEDVVRAKNTNIVNALAGKVAGVYINNSSGMAGSSSRITIRGNSSFLFDNQPLFIVDGVPYNNTEYEFEEGDEDQALFYGTTSNTGIDIDPNTIENVNFLKGAAATALYGSRAANGAIIITTKTGSNTGLKRPVITYSANFGWEKVIPHKYQKNYGQGVDGEYWDGQTDDTKTYLIWGPRLDTTDIPTYNHYDFFRTGQTNEHAISAQGGNEYVNYFGSLSHLKQKGIVPKNEYIRTNATAKFSAKITKKFTFNGKFSYSRSENDRLPEGNDRTSVMWTILCGPITYNFDPAVDEDGEQRMYRNSTRNNPYWLVDNVLFSEQRDRFTPYIGFEYEILPWMNITSKLGIDQYASESVFYENTGTRGNYPGGRIQLTNRVFREVNSDIMLNINKDLMTDIHLDLTLGNNINTRYYSFVRNQGTDFIIPEYYHLNNTTTKIADNGLEKIHMSSIYGQAQFSYKTLLYLTLTGRNDWTSTLPTDVNSYFYPSVGVSFAFSELLEQYNDILDFGKLRLSWAQVGNDAPAYSTQTGFIPANPSDGQRGNIAFPFRNTGSYQETNIRGNPDLKPEMSSEYEVGLDMRFFKGRLNVDFSYYDKTSVDQVFNAPMAPSTGFAQMYVNAGKMKNKGIELAVSSTPVKLNDFSWDIGITYSKNNNEVIELTEGVDNLRLAGFTSPGIYIREDAPYGVIWGRRYQRNEEGKVMIDDDPDSFFYGLPLEDPDLGPIGNTMPDWTGSLRNTLSYKGLSLSALIDMKVGGQIMNMDEYYSSFYGTSILTEDRENPVIFPDAVKSDGSPNDIEVDPVDYYQNITNFDEFQIQKADYIKLREISLGYTLPVKLLEKMPISGLSVTASGRNLWMKTDDSFTGSDPEQSLYGSANGQGFLSFNMPSAKSFNISLKATF